MLSDAPLVGPLWDNLMRWPAQRAAIPLDEYSAEVAGEGFGTLVEQALDWVAKGWLNKALAVGLGLVTNGYVWMRGPEISERTRREMTAAGWHLIDRIFALRPQDLMEIRITGTASMIHAMRGNGFAALLASCRTPAEWQAALASLGVPVRRTPGRGRGIQTQTQGVTAVKDTVGVGGVDPTAGHVHTESGDGMYQLCLTE